MLMEWIAPGLAIVAIILCGYALLRHKDNEEK